MAQQENGVHLFIREDQLSGVFDQDVSGAEETELFIAEVAAAGKGASPKKVRATIVPRENFLASATVELDPSSSGVFTTSPTRSGKYLGVTLTLSNAEFVNVNAVDINGDDLLTRNSKASVTGAGVTVGTGQLLEGGAQPETYFLFLDRDGHKHKELTNSDTLNINLTNKVATVGTKATIPVRWSNIVPPGCKFIN